MGGVGSLGLCHTAVTEITGELGLDGYGLRSSLRDQVVAQQPSTLKAPAGTGRQAGPGTFHFLPRPCPLRCPQPPL